MYYHYYRLAFCYHAFKGSEECIVLLFCFAFPEKEYLVSRVLKAHNVVQSIWLMCADKKQSYRLSLFITAKLMRPLL